MMDPMFWGWGWGGGSKRNLATSDVGGRKSGDKIQLVSSGQKSYVTINEIIFVKSIGTIHHLSQINKVFILPEPFNPDVYDIFEFKYISWPYK